MRTLLIATLALAVVASTPAAQSPPKKPPCDSAAVLLTTEPIFGVGVKTIAAVCPAIADRIVLYQAKHPDLTAIELVSELVHGKIPTPPGPIPSPTPVPTPTPTPTPDPVPPVVTASSWTKLGNAGAVYTFTGFHVARWTTSDTSKALKTMAYGLLECGLSGFSNKAPGGSGSSWCDIGPTLYDTLAVPVKMGPIFASTIVTPKGSPGVSVERVRSSGGAGIKTDGTGSFRTTCELSKFIFDDPIVFPDTTGVSHLHMLFGNTAVTGKTNSLTLASTGNSTCIGGIDNRTAYWTPAMISASGNAVMPDRSAFYYKTGYNMKPESTQTLPVGLKMIAGDKNATGQQVVPGPQYIITWTCLNGSAKSAGDATIPACKAGDEVRLTVIFPQCWNGKDLDSPNHKSHMAYPNYAAGKCPATHPVQLPEITEHFDFPVTPGANPSTWHLSSDMDLAKPGGLSAHADWMNGWDPATMLLIVQNCLQKKLDCEIGGLGGKILY